MEFRHINLLLIGALALLLAGCEPAQEPTSPITSSAEPEHSAITQASATEALWLAGTNSLQSSLASSKNLNQALILFLAEPTEANLTRAQEAWSETELAFHHFYFFSQFGITEPQVFANLARACFTIAAHPIQPGYLDYVGPYPYSGLVHDISVALTADNLKKQHGMTDAEDVVLGLYAIEYLIFGENKQRPVTDYTPVTQLSTPHKEMGFKTIDETPNNRRRNLLKLQAELLNQDLLQLANDWAAHDADSMRDRWQKLPSSVRRMTVYKTFERTLTQLLLRIATATPQEESGHSTNTSRYQARRIAAEINSLNGAYLWINEQQRNNVTEQLTNAKTLLLQLANETEAQPTHWQQTYQALKTALDNHLGAS